MPAIQDLKCEIVEKEIVKVELVEKEILNVKLNVIDMLSDRAAIVQAHFVDNESPTQINSKKFQTDYSFITSSLVVYLNGIKEKYITVTSENTFEFEIDIDGNNMIECNYIKSKD